LTDYKFEVPEEAPPPAVDDEVRRREEEELQRVLEMSMQDKGGRDRWNAYTTASSSGAGGSGAGSSASKAPVASSSSSSMPPPASAASSKTSFALPVYQSGGYVPARTPPPKAQSPVASPSFAPVVHAPAPVSVEATSTRVIPSATSAASVAPAASDPSTTATAAATSSVVTRVRALHAFEPTEAGELAFEKGDIIKVVDRGYQDWWRGQLKGRTGIFPVNYVVRIQCFSAMTTAADLMSITRNQCQSRQRLNWQRRQNKKQLCLRKLPTWIGS
jgi:signal transducing adaptor molecule